MNKKHFIVFFILLILPILSSATEITYVLRTEGGDPIVNVTVSIYNETWELVSVNDTNDIGNFSFSVENSTVYYIYGVIPSSNYHAVLGNVTLTESVFMNDVLGGSVRLINTLGQPLEAQDCSVVIIENNTNTLIGYPTQCIPGENRIDPQTGNWISLNDCPLTDSNGQ